MLPRVLSMFHWVMERGYMVVRCAGAGGGRVDGGLTFSRRMSSRVSLIRQNWRTDVVFHKLPQRMENADDKSNPASWSSSSSSPFLPADLGESGSIRLGAVVGVDCTYLRLT
jgi:hypothetical protein